MSAEKLPAPGKLQRIKHSIASTGVRRSLADLLTLLLAYKPERDHSFDRRFGTDTAGSVPATDLGIEDPRTREQAILYLPSPADVTRWMLRTVNVEPSRCTFVDLGCGKGRVLLVASERPFERIVGVEISPALVAVARANAGKVREAEPGRTPIEVECVDAATFAFPEVDLLVHLYHPFEADLLARVLAQLGSSWRARPRRVVVAYLLYAAAVDTVQAVFAHQPWLILQRHEASILGQYDWLIYATPSG